MIRWIAILSLLQLVAFWKILGRMGYPPWLAIMASIPLVNLVIPVLGVATFTHLFHRLAAAGR